MAAILKMPMNSDLPAYAFKISLSDTFYTIYVRLNTRMDRWIMEIQDASGNQILSGIPVLIERDLYNQYPTLELPAGPMVCVDDTQQDQQPTQFSFGVNKTLYYVDPNQ